MRGTGNVPHRASGLLAAYETKDGHPGVVGTIGTDSTVGTIGGTVVHTMPDEAEESAAPQGSEFHEVLPLMAPSKRSLGSSRQSRR
jgi:hypothetical protein